MSDLVQHFGVVVVGAGVSGLVATRLLTQQGKTVRCFEARDRVGGRVLTVTDSGLAIDMGASWYWPNEPMVRSLLDQLSLGSFPQFNDGEAMFESLDQPPRRLPGNPLGSGEIRFESGAQSLADALASILPSGTLSQAEPVLSVDFEGERIAVRTDRSSVTADQVILAVPPALALTSIEFTPELPENVARAAGSTPVWMSETIKAVAIYEHPFWRDEDLAGTAMSYRGPFGEFHDHGGPGPNGAGAIFGFAQAARVGSRSDEEIGDLFREQLVRIFGIRAANPVALHVRNWAHEPFTNPEFRSSRANEGSFGNPVLREPFGHGRIHWASTEIDTDYAGHIEGAIRAAMHATERLLS